MHCQSYSLIQIKSVFTNINIEHKSGLCSSGILGSNVSNAHMFLYVRVLGKLVSAMEDSRSGMSNPRPSSGFHCGMSSLRTDNMSSLALTFPMKLAYENHTCGGVKDAKLSLHCS